MKSKVRGDYIYENDVALGRLLDYLENTEDPRRPGKNFSPTPLLFLPQTMVLKLQPRLQLAPFEVTRVQPMKEVIVFRSS